MHHAIFASQYILFPGVLLPILELKIVFPNPLCLPGCRRGCGGGGCAGEVHAAGGWGEPVLEHALGPQHVAAVSVLQEAAAVQLQTQREENKADLLTDLQKYYCLVKLCIGHKKSGNRAARRGGSAILHSSEAEQIKPGGVGGSFGDNLFGDSSESDHLWETRFP